MTRSIPTVPSVQLGARSRPSTVQQAQDAILHLINGKRAGERLPSESQLAANLGVARGTLREAFKSLEEAGLIVVQHGNGRFVSALAGLHVTRPITRFESASEMLQGRGYDCVTRVLSLELTSPNDEERVALRTARDASVVRLRRLRSRGGEVLMFSVNTFPSTLLSEDELDESEFEDSLSDWLEARGHRPVSSAAQIQACSIPADVGALPEVDERTPWLLIIEQCVDNDGAPVLLSRDYHRGDVFSFHVLRRVGR